MKPCARSRLACQMRSETLGADSRLSTYCLNSWRRSAPSAASAYCSACARAKSTGRRDWRMPSNARSTSCCLATMSSDGNSRSQPAADLADTMGSVASRAVGLRNPNMAPQIKCANRRNAASRSRRSPAFFNKVSSMPIQIRLSPLSLRTRGRMDRARSERAARGRVRHRACAGTANHHRARKQQVGCHTERTSENRCETRHWRRSNARQGGCSPLHRLALRHIQARFARREIRQLARSQRPVRLRAWAPDG